MSMNERSVDDAVYVLHAMARILRASPNALDRDWAELHASYLEDIAGAVVRDAGLDVERVRHSLGFLGYEWDHALIPILFPSEQIEDVATRAHDAKPAPDDGVPSGT